MTEVKNNNQNTNVDVKFSTVEKVNKAGVENVKIMQIPFIPEISIMDLSTLDITRAINSSLKPIVDRYFSSRVYFKENSLGIEICIDCKSRLIKNTAITMLGAASQYEITDELKAKLSPFITLGAPIKSRVIDLNRNKYSNDKGMVIELDALKTITAILVKPEDGFVYKIDSVHSKKKNGEALLRLIKQKPNAQIKLAPVNNNNNNNNNNANKKHNNQNNNNRKNRKKK